MYNIGAVGCYCIRGGWTCKCYMHNVGAVGCYCIREVGGHVDFICIM